MDLGIASNQFSSVASSTPSYLPLPARVFSLPSFVPQCAIFVVAQKVSPIVYPIFRPIVLLAAFALVLPVIHAQPAPSRAPVPAPITSAQKIFIANGGMDAFSLQAFEELGLEGTTAYDSLYSAVNSWNKYQLVTSPADADIVLVVRCTAPLVGEGGGWNFQHIFATTKWQFQTEVVIEDAKTHFSLWTLTQPVRPANLKGTWRKNIADSNAALAGDLKSLLAPAP